MATRPTITERTTEAIGYKTVDIEWTYNKLLEIFDNDCLVRSLILRCMGYEDQISKLETDVSRLQDALATASVATDKINGIGVGDRVVHAMIRIPLKGTIVAMDNKCVKVHWDDGTDGILSWEYGVTASAYQLYAVKEVKE